MRFVSPPVYTSIPPSQSSAHKRPLDLPPSLRYVGVLHRYSQRWGCMEGWLVALGRKPMLVRAVKRRKVWATWFKLTAVLGQRIGLKALTADPDRFWSSLAEHRKDLAYTHTRSSRVDFFPVYLTTFPSGYRKLNNPSLAAQTFTHQCNHLD